MNDGDDEGVLLITIGYPRSLMLSWCRKHVTTTKSLIIIVIIIIVIIIIIIIITIIMII